MDCSLLLQPILESAFGSAVYISSRNYCNSFKDQLHITFEVGNNPDVDLTKLKQKVQAIRLSSTTKVSIVDIFYSYNSINLYLCDPTPFITLVYSITQGLTNFNSTNFCCNKRCFVIPDCQVDGIACRVCRNYSYCICKCASFNV